MAAKKYRLSFLMHAHPAARRAPDRGRQGLYLSGEARNVKLKWQPYTGPNQRGLVQKGLSGQFEHGKD